MEELHLFILWENAQYQKDIIIKDIKQSFEIVNIYAIKWSDDKFSEDLTRFYGTLLPKGSGKEVHCGTGRFLLIIVKDKSPKYEKRDTSKGPKIVNVNMFDKKEYYRELTGGGHKVHATNSQAETNHDLTLLLGKNVEDYLKESDNLYNENIIEMDKDLIGSNSWKDANEMFYALNNCVNYTVLRNYECLPEEIYVNEHNDIDILCESEDDCAYILNAKKVFPDLNRVHYVTKVENAEAFFDIRYIGDNYYNKDFENALLKTRIWNDKGFYTVNDEYYFYSLLYHALVHKHQFADDYRQRLKNMKPDIIKDGMTYRDLLIILKKWIIENDFYIVKPIDSSVCFNEHNAIYITPDYSSYQKEENILKYIKEGKTFEEIDDEDNCIEIVNALSQMRENLLSWYPIPKDSTVLEIGSNYGELTKMLCKKANKVTSLTFSKRRIDSIKTRLAGVENVELIDANFSNIENRKFDFIVIVDSIDKLLSKYNSLDRVFKELNTYIEENGKILIAIDNPLGIQNFNCISNNEKLLQYYITKEKIEQASRNKGVINFKYYYPLPNFYIPNVIYTDEMLPDAENISRDLTLYNKDSKVLQRQVDLYKAVINDNKEKFKEFANSYLIEISKSKIDNDVKFVSFSNLRKKQYRINTIIKGNAVYKSNVTQDSKEHIQSIKRNIDILNDSNINTLDSYTEDIILSKYCKERTLNRVLIETYLDKGLESMLTIISSFKDEIKSKLEAGNIDNNVFKRYNIEYNNEEIKDLNFIKHGLWDLIFQNCFYIDNNFFFYDQEWHEEDIPLEFILYRAITYFTEIKKYVDNDELLEKLNLIKFKNIFEILDFKLQENIRNDKIWQMHLQQKKLSDFLYENNEHIKYLEENLRVLRVDNNAKQDYIERLEKQNQELTVTNSNVINSTSWKITEPIRRISTLLKNKNN